MIDLESIDFLPPCDHEIDDRKIHYIGTYLMIKWNVRCHCNKYEFHPISDRNMILAEMDNVFVNSWLLQYETYVQLTREL